MAKFVLDNAITRIAILETESERKAGLEGGFDGNEIGLVVGKIAEVKIKIVGDVAIAGKAN